MRSLRGPLHSDPGNIPLTSVNIWLWLLLLIAGTVTKKDKSSLEGKGEKGKDKKKTEKTTRGNRKYMMSLWHDIFDTFDDHSFADRLLLFETCYRSPRNSSMNISGPSGFVSRDCMSVKSFQNGLLRDIADSFSDRETNRPKVLIRHALAALFRLHLSNTFFPFVNCYFPFFFLKCLRVYRFSLPKPILKSGTAKFAIKTSPCGR